MTSCFEIQGCPNRKQKKENIYVAVEKQQRKSKAERKWKANEETGSSLRELKTGRLVLTDKF